MNNKVVANKEKEIIVVCSVCLKIKNGDKWQSKHLDIIDILDWNLFNSLPILHKEIREMIHEIHFNDSIVSHGLCPECFEEQMKDL